MASRASLAREYGKDNIRVNTLTLGAKDSRMMTAQEFVVDAGWT